MPTPRLVSRVLRDQLSTYLRDSASTYQKLAAEAELSYNYVRRVCKGQLFPSMKALRAICEVAKLDFPSIWSAMLEEKTRGQRDLVAKSWVTDGTIKGSTWEIALALNDPKFTDFSELWGDLSVEDQNEVFDFALFLSEKSRQRTIRQLQAASTEVTPEVI